MREFTSLEWFTVRGRPVVTVELDQEEDRDPLLAKIQAEGGVMIDGKHYQVDGIESYCITPIRKGSPIGLRLLTTTHEKQA